MTAARDEDAGRSPAAPLPVVPPPDDVPAWHDLLSLARRILEYANVRVPRVDFLRKLSRLVLTAAGCEELSLMRMKDGAPRYECEAQLGSNGRLRFRNRVYDSRGSRPWPAPGADRLDGIRRLVLRGRPPAGADGSAGADREAGADGRWTPHGSWWCRGTDPAAGAAGRGLAIIRFEIEEGNLGLLELRGPHRPLDRSRVEFHECVARFIGIAIANRRAREALCRRVNELTCLNDLTEVVGVPGRPLAAILDEAVGLLPGGFPFPGRVRVGLVLDEVRHGPADQERGASPLAAPLVVAGRERGRLEAVCLDEDGRVLPPEQLPAERSVLESLARQLSLLLERRQVRQERARLEDQLRHADRLATIGQLAAGVAHELNEPLAGVLGFAELVGQEEGLSEQGRRDVQKVVAAAIHGREIVRKLLIFARQVPSRREAVDLDAVAREAVDVLRGRCARTGIAVELDLAGDLPPLTADAGQLQQVLVNLAVNAIQAMPEGGRLRVATAGREGAVELVVEDTGAGMTAEVRRQIFLPFFTTKQVGQGTGLGLAVVHGIVADHGGGITVASEPGRGSRFTVRLPLGSGSGDEGSAPAGDAGADRGRTA